VRNPYITGPYVTERRHYGRKELLDYLLHGENQACWVVGNRRIGKTSLLRQLELTALAEGRQVPLFWDMQGSDDYARLGQYLSDAANEHCDRLEPLGVSAAALNEEDPAVLLTTLRRAAHRAGRELLLLCDETEVLIKIARDAPDAMQRLHRAMTAGAGLRMVATSTQAIYELHDVCEAWPTSPFLAGFDMSQALSSLTQHSARALICQSQHAEPVQVAPEVIDAICDCTNNHPYLIQLLCSRLFQEGGWLRPLTEDDLVVDPVLKGFFNVDYRSLTPADRRILGAVHAAQVIDEATLVALAGGDNTAELHRRVHNLERLGYLRRIYGQFAIGNQFLANWLAGEPATPEAVQAGISEAALTTALSRRQVQETSFLQTRLNSQRTRLVELEALRARDLLNVSPQVLVEIEEQQRQIIHLRRLLGEIQETV
jgi:hypothetical protein